MAAVLVGVVSLLCVACGGGGSDETPTPNPTERATPTASPTPSPEFNAAGVRYCRYVPGESEVAEMPDEVRNPGPPTSAPMITQAPQTEVDAATTEAQLLFLEDVEGVIADTYVYPDFNGRDWEAIQAEYEGLVAAGLSQADFYTTVSRMIYALGDEHSYFRSPEQVAEDERLATEGNSFVGIGIQASWSEHLKAGLVTAVFPNSPAAEAGLRLHDQLTEVDGLPIFEEGLASYRTLGPEGTSFELTYNRLGEGEQTVELTRQAISGFTPIDSCIVRDSRIGYILLPTFAESNIDDQVRDALTLMTADGPLDGLVLDNRLNGGGLSSVLEPMLGFFTDGVVGRYVSRTGERDLAIVAEDIGGSQETPLVILTGADTGSYAEVFTGVLQHEGRAIVIGGATSGNVETLDGTEFTDYGAQLWLASETFAPTGEEPGLWEGVGITPDVELATRWDLFTEESDPALADAVAVLGG